VARKGVLLLFRTRDSALAGAAPLRRIFPVPVPVKTTSRPAVAAALKGWAAVEAAGKAAITAATVATAAPALASPIEPLPSPVEGRLQHHVVFALYGADSVAIDARFFFHEAFLLLLFLTECIPRSKRKIQPADCKRVVYSLFLFPT
jgi:hypothetical protein